MRKILLVIPIVALVGVGALAILNNPGPRTGGVVDGWVIGDAVTCDKIGASSATQCQALGDRAIATMQTSGSATVTSVTVHLVGDKVVNGQRVNVAFGQPHSVLGLVVVELSNGVRHAAMFGCAGTTQPGQTPDPLCPKGGLPFP